MVGEAAELLEMRFLERFVAYAVVQESKVAEHAGVLLGVCGLEDESPSSLIARVHAPGEMCCAIGSRERVFPEEIAGQADEEIQQVLLDLLESLFLVDEGPTPLMLDREEVLDSGADTGAFRELGFEYLEVLADLGAAAHVELLVGGRVVSQAFRGEQSEPAAVVLRAILLDLLDGTEVLHGVFFLVGEGEATSIRQRVDEMHDAETTLERQVSREVLAGHGLLGIETGERIDGHGASL